MAALAEQAGGHGDRRARPGRLYGPLNNADQLTKVAGFLDRLPDHADGTQRRHSVSGPGYFFQPTVVAGLRQDDEIIQNEVFGPVITVQTFGDEAEAVRHGQRCALRLGRPACGQAITVGPCGWRSRLDFGCVWINTHIPIVAEMPHGGFKQSGYGKDLSMYGFEDYTRIKHVMSNIEM